MDNNIEEHATLVTGPLPSSVVEGKDVVAVEPRCPKCTGPMVKCDIGYVGIYGWWLERAGRQASTLGPPRMISSDVAASTCIRCGYTELYAKDPAALVGVDEAN